MENGIDIREIYWPRDRRGTIKVNCPGNDTAQPIFKCSKCPRYEGLVFGKGIKCFIAKEPTHDWSYRSI